jgi:hypothetical protein
MFIQNKYYNWYYNIVNRAKSRCLDEEYKEKHHIIPKSLGGDNSSTNIVALTAREHFICHWLLIKITKGSSKRKMAYAIRRMMSGNKYQNRNFNSKKYENLRKKINKISYGRKHTAEDKQKISKALTGRTFTEEHKNNLSKAKKGKPKPPHIADKLRTLRKGKKNSQEHKDKCSKALKGRKISEIARQNMSKNHADVSGASNPKSKIWKVTSPNGNTTIINGTMTQFCQKHNLPASVMRAIGRTGNKPKSGRCVGWDVKIIET